MLKTKDSLPYTPGLLRVSREVKGTTMDLQQLLERLGKTIEVAISPEAAASPSEHSDPSTPQVDAVIQEEIETVRKANVFADEVTEAEMEIIRRRVERNQRQYQEYEEREYRQKARVIRECFDFLTDGEIKLALEEQGGQEGEVILKLASPGYLHGLRKTISLSYNPVPVSMAMTASESMGGGGIDPSGSSRDQGPSPKQYQAMLEKRRSIIKNRATDEGRRKCTHSVRRLKLEDALKQLKENGGKAGGMEGWSAARIRAYQMREQNPNSYYYRFNDPGETQRTGVWSEVEKKLFFARLKEMGANGQWGIFSQTIPGRVGYQCSNFYRHLLETQVLHDPNYFLDEKGKAKYLFANRRGTSTPEAGRAVPMVRPKKRRRAPVRRSRWSGTDEDDEEDDIMDDDDDDDGPNGEEGTMMDGGDTHLESQGGSENGHTAGVSRSESGRLHGGETRERRNTRQRRNTRRGWGDDDEEEEDSLGMGDHMSTSSFMSRIGTTKRARAMRGEVLVEEGEGREEFEERLRKENPLPDLIDPITLDEVIRPAISPYGHVMSWESWVKCLDKEEGENRCPLTKNRLEKHQLKLLTLSNIHAYRMKRRNETKEFGSIAN
ncbi:hypothetical protein BJ684DRAFT_16128 [Piptocephalis cylindrospora]|uniref:Myb-like domain-containing protein n=1 Tax=Piptocephalis cylindrospora TaxID=1907219 RepID=A0A4P9Y3M2_9FUNG|nr:hypothetical protein BJ684DRAFT_16128 [Piptocephalis cylindrospora]|eukprot:RKP13475.1 hypothetical protein BJ684DRAFT_16128 [Piptocephalis cylindrospora]